MFTYEYITDPRDGYRKLRIDCDEQKQIPTSIDDGILIWKNKKYYTPGEDPETQPTLITIDGKWISGGSSPVSGIDIASVIYKPNDEGIIDISAGVAKQADIDGLKARVDVIDPKIEEIENDLDALAAGKQNKIHAGQGIKIDQYGTRVSLADDIPTYYPYSGIKFVDHAGGTQFEKDICVNYSEDQFYITDDNKLAIINATLADYDSLINKPKINGIEVEGEHLGGYYNLQTKLEAGMGIFIDEATHTISAENQAGSSYIEHEPPLYADISIHDHYVYLKYSTTDFSVNDNGELVCKVPNTGFVTTPTGGVICNTTSGTDANQAGIMAFAAGKKTNAGGMYSAAFGVSTTAAGEASFAGGNGSMSSGEASFSFGKNCIAAGVASTAIGQNCQAEANCSHAEGIGVKTLNFNTYAIGKYNLEDTTKPYCFVVGNGTDAEHRSNALAIDWEGNLYLKGTVHPGSL